MSTGLPTRLGMTEAEQERAGSLASRIFDVSEFLQKVLEAATSLGLGKALDAATSWAGLLQICRSPGASRPVARTYSS